VFRLRRHGGVQLYRLQRVRHPDVLGPPLAPGYRHREEGRPAPHQQWRHLLLGVDPPLDSRVYVDRCQRRQVETYETLWCAVSSNVLNSYYDFVSI